MLKDELAKRQSELENNTVHRDNMSDYAIINLMGGIITITMTGEGIGMKIITKGIGDKGFHTMGTVH